MPYGFDSATLAKILQQHPDLQPPRSDTNDLSDDGDANSTGNGVWVHTLAPDLQHYQVATVRFRRLPTKLRTLARVGQLTINIEDPQARASLPNARLAIDQNFHGITVLFSPSAGDHAIDVLAVPGILVHDHPYGSFVHKADGHMWLSDSLPRDMPTARVMIYGYESGLQDDTAFAGLDDLASSLHLDVRRLLRLGNQTRLILIGHSLGGLLIKGALVRMTEPDSVLELKSVVGVLFFGVPNDGMDIESLVPIVNNRLSRGLLESLSAINSNILRLQGRSFAKVLNQTAMEIFCFYETKVSPTAAQVSSPSSL